MCAKIKLKACIENVDLKNLCALILIGLQFEKETDIMGLSSKIENKLDWRMINTIC